MKRAGNLWPQVIDFGNLLLAARRAQACKRFRPSVLDFNFGLEKNLLQLQRELEQGAYRPGEFRLFEILEPKRRIICAAPYRDRVVHHALCNVIAPVLDRSFSTSCFANRRGMGSHMALRKAAALARRRKYVLRADVEKYFPSMDHDIMKAGLRRRIKCAPTLALCDLIIDHAPDTGESPIRHYPGDELLTPLERRRGLPIGNLTSQIWANEYLSGVDHAITRKFGGGIYLRYVDDLALFSNDRGELTEAMNFLEEGMKRVRLTLHPVKTFIAPVTSGVNWLGFRLLPDRVRVRTENLRRGKRRLREQQTEFRLGRLSKSQMDSSIQAWAAHLAHGDTWRLRGKIFGSVSLTQTGEGLDKTEGFAAAIGTTIRSIAGPPTATTTPRRTRTTTTASVSPDLPRAGISGWESGGRA